MSPQAGFVLQDQVVPRLKAAIPRTVLTVGSEDHEELIQDATCLAARILHNAEIKGKQITASNAAYYAIQHCKSGRRAAGHSNSDVLGSATQINSRSWPESLEMVVAIDEITGGEVLLHDVLSIDQEDPGTKAARKMDWEQFMAALSARDQAVVSLLIEGKDATSIAKELRVCSSTISHRKTRIAKSIVEFMGDSILVDIQRKPKWTDNLTATKEKMACRFDRLH
jgi:DNA-directed RNA polymerase specialized sigma24 family protein